MTQEQLNKYLSRLYELKDLSIIALNNKDYSSLKRYGNEMKQIKKILKKAEKEAKNNE